VEIWPDDAEKFCRPKRYPKASVPAQPKFQFEDEFEFEDNSEAQEKHHLDSHSLPQLIGIREPSNYAIVSRRL